MSFDSGRVGFRLFYLREQYDSSLVEKFARCVAPPVSSITDEPITGWVTGKHLLDRDITDERCVIGPYLHVQYMKADKKVPPSYLNAQVKIEEEVEKKARGVNFLSRAVRAEIKQRVEASLKPQALPTLSGIPVVVDFRNNMLITGALSDQNVDKLSPAFKEVAGELPIVVTPETAAMHRKQINAMDLDPVIFTPEETDDSQKEPSLGMDFLTWLWFNWDRGGGVFHLPDGREAAYMFEGPLTFFRDGEGAHEALLRKGTPLDSREASAALLCGKKLKQVKMNLVVDEEIIEATVDSDFCFRSVKLPKSDQEEPEGEFEERMMNLETLFTAWFDLYDRFLDLRTDSSRWPETIREMSQWILHIGGAQQVLRARPEA